jgi:ABC-type lipoprotein export system ATPase subunit
MPAMIGGVGREEALKKAEELLAQMNIADRARHRPAELSGGEQQRVAVARALINQPRILLADEPSGNLDEENGRNLHALLISLAKQRDLTVVVVTHNVEFSREADVLYTLHEGLLNATSPISS